MRDDSDEPVAARLENLTGEVWVLQNELDEAREELAVRNTQLLMLAGTMKLGPIPVSFKRVHQAVKERQEIWDLYHRTSSNSS